MRNETTRPCSEVETPPTCNEVFDCLRFSRRHDPRTIRIKVRKHLLALKNSPEELTVQLVPTNLRVILDSDWELPDYELDGWLLESGTPRLWLRLHLRTNDDGEIVEATAFALHPSEELGTDRSAITT